MKQHLHAASGGRSPAPWCVPTAWQHDAGSPPMQGDVRAEQDLIDNGPRSTRRTKLICTIGPASRSTEMLATLAANGMNVARLNMCHGSQASHRRTIQNIRQLNKDKGCGPSRLCAPTAVAPACLP